VLHGAILSSRILSCGSFDRRTTNPPTLRHTGGIVQATSGRPPGRCQLPTRPQDARRCLRVPNFCCYAPGDSIAS
jgi:hypothetical protein